MMPESEKQSVSVGFIGYVIGVVVGGAILAALLVTRVIPSPLGEPNLDLSLVFGVMVAFVFEGYVVRSAGSDRRAWALPGVFVSIGYTSLLAILHFLIALAIGVVMRGLLHNVIASISLSTLLFGMALSGVVLGRSIFHAIPFGGFRLVHLVFTMLLVVPLLAVDLSIAQHLQSWFPLNKTASEIEAIIRRSDFLWVFFFICFCPAIGEELIFRGMIGRGLVSRYGVMVGVLVTSLLFALVHMNVVQGITAFMAGIVIHLVYLWSGSIWLPMLLHCANNVLTILYARETLPALKRITPHPLHEGPISPFLVATSLVAMVGLMAIFSSTRRRPDFGVDDDDSASGTDGLASEASLTTTVTARQLTEANRPFPRLHLAVVSIGLIGMALVVLNAVPDHAEKLASAVLSGPRPVSEGSGDRRTVYWTIAGESPDVRKAVFDHIANAPKQLEKKFRSTSQHYLLHAIVGTDPDVREYIAETYVRPNLNSESRSKKAWTVIAEQLRIDGAGPPQQVKSDRGHLKYIEDRQDTDLLSNRGRTFATPEEAIKAVTLANDANMMAIAFVGARQHSEACTPKNLILFLKYPQCVGSARLAILDQFEKISGQQFDDNLWNVVARYDELGLSEEILRQPATRGQ